MLRSHVIALSALALCVALGVGTPGQGEPALRQQLVYSEDFTGDPGYSSTNELYAFWDAQGGSYFALDLDVGSGYGQYAGYSPEFGLVVGDFTVTFDLAILAPDWGCYPGIVFLNTLVPDPGQPDGTTRVFSARYAWSDYIRRRFVLQIPGGAELLTAGSPTVGDWYHFTIVYDSSSQTADWTVESGGIFHHVTGASFPIATGFNRLYIGEISEPPMYGEHSAIRVDNIEIWSGQVAVKQTSWGVIKGAYR